MIQKALLILLAVVSSLTAIFWGTLPRSGSHEPNTEVAKAAQPDQLIRNLGTLKPGTQVDDEVRFTNRSPVQWTVSQVSSDCGCLVHSLDRKTIPPGKDVVLRYRFAAPQSPGVVRRRVSLTFQEQAAPPRAIDIIARVEPWCHAIPERVVFSDFPSGTQGEVAPSQDVRLRLAQGHEIDVTSPPRTPEWLKVRYLSSTRGVGGSGSEGEARDEVVAQVTPDLRRLSGREILSGFITFVSRENDLQLNVPVELRMSPSLSSEPRTLFLGTQKCGDALVRSLHIRIAHAAEPIGQLLSPERIRVTHDLGDHLQIDLPLGDDADEVIAHCHFTMPSRDGFLTGSLLIELDERRQLRIPVNARVVGDEHL